MINKTQVIIVGGGPSGLLLARLLHLHGIDCLVLERQSQSYVAERVRAGILESGTVDMLQLAGVAQRALKEGLFHDGLVLTYGQQQHRIDVKGLTGSQVLAYGQTEIQKDLIAATQGQVVWEAHDVALHDFYTDHPAVTFEFDGVTRRVDCDFIIGCDGYHGISRASVSPADITVYERLLPVGWLGVLADAPPVSHEVVYANHERGFALCSMRSPTRSRYYVQCPTTDSIEQWSDERFWQELKSRLPDAISSRLQTAPSIEKRIVPLRSFVAEPMRFGQLFLVGDAAHVVPPTGAKGLNLAVADVRLLFQALTEHYQSQRDDLLDQYSSRALARIWKATRFSWWLTQMTHRLSDEPMARRLQLAELDYIAQSPAASKVVAENYAGLWV